VLRYTTRAGNNTWASQCPPAFRPGLKQGVLGRQVFTDSTNKTFLIQQTNRWIGTKSERCGNTASLLFTHPSPAKTGKQPAPPPSLNLMPAETARDLLDPSSFEKGGRPLRGARAVITQSEGPTRKSPKIMQCRFPKALSNVTARPGAARLIPY